MQGVQRVVDTQRQHQDRQQVRELRPGDERKAKPTRDVGEVPDKPLHPQQCGAQSKHHDGDIGPASQANIEQHDDGQPHHHDEARTGLEFPVDLNVHALTQQERDGGAVVGAKVALEVHVGPFRGAARPLGLHFKAG